MPEHLYYANGIDAETGEYLAPPRTARELATLARGRGVDRDVQHSLEKKLEHEEAVAKGLIPGLEARDLAQAGWGLVFLDGDERAAEIHKALTPLRRLRRRQAGRDLEHYYQEYFGKKALEALSSKRRFLNRHRAGEGPANPDHVPYYLLLVGDPAQISYRFQYELDIEYAVGRLHFETIDEYRRYAESVVAAETHPPAGARRAIFFGAESPNDPATSRSARELALPLSQAVAGKAGWVVDQVIGPEANKQRLTRLLGGDETPSLLFTAGHGISRTNKPGQLELQGALLCSDWQGAKTPAYPEMYFSAADVTDEARPAGLISVHFACYSAGTPERDDYAHQEVGPRRSIAPHPFVARLPQRLLGHPNGGALAVVGHVDRCFVAAPRVEVLAEVFERLMDGHPVGSALEPLNKLHATLAAQLVPWLEEKLVDGIELRGEDEDQELAELWTGHHDARAYTIVGDPAVRVPGTWSARPYIPLSRFTPQPKTCPDQSGIRGGIQGRVNELHALLIGCDGYLPNQPFGSNQPGYLELPGCVADIRAVERHLSEVLEVKRITRLLASRRGANGLPPEPPDSWPTYENMVATFERLVSEASPGDQVYIHYSGHGGVVRTCLPEVKGGYDETLVPVNVGDRKARHLRDVELVYWLRQMTDRGLFVTVVLDCCHSGGALRGGGVQVGPEGEVARGNPVPDGTDRPGPDVDTEELLRAWGDRGAPGTRDGREPSALRAAEGWVLLAACRPNEQAWNLTKGDVRHGVLTWFWLEALRTSRAPVTYGQLYERILPWIRRMPAQRTQQTPMLYGDGERIVFGKDRIPYASTVVVTEVEETGDILLNTGPIQGVYLGARFALYPPGSELNDPSLQLAEAEVIELGATDVRARIVEPGPVQPIVPGAPAMLCDPFATELRSTVRVAERDVQGRKVPEPLREAAEAAIQDDRSHFIRLAEGPQRPNLTVRLAADGSWEILDSWRKSIQFPFVPRVPASEATTLARRLVHLTKFRNVARLTNPEKPLRRNFFVEWAEPSGGDAIRLQAGETAKLRVSSRSSYDLNIAVLTMRADGSIQWGLLGAERGRFLVFSGGKGETRELKVAARPLPGLDNPLERIKVFAALTGVSNFGWLELPAWDGLALPRPALRNSNPLELLLASLAGEQPAQREVVISGVPGEEWDVRNVELRIEP